ncbi:DNA glycosylase AlkZ-like family protein [Nocardioides sp. CFH 31398]|uniref:DNA glycosylase AlkZ-like family protein n=1 Tax=Nocardioides sp. CFH 31398 TaxID=2919579 RepID=UPI001F05CBBF|nr:crosslink repair DNA glycosylase YcaQ family protein [Nocardioides sp. CFH 31398]MCH1867124.1 winged helix DNA-binding domain-containing protein [Nocardioides sp. CFH 31398]
MSEVHVLSVDRARQVAVRAQLLTEPRPTDAADVVRHLTTLQLDPTSYVARSADLVLWGRLGSAYAPGDLQDLLDTGRLVELRMHALPAEDLRLHTAEMAAWPAGTGTEESQRYLAAWVAANDGCRRDVLAALRADGPLPTSALPDTCVRPWRSSGWTGGKNLQRLLDFLVQRGEVALAGREGRTPLWDLASRVYPDDDPVPLEQALAERGRRRLAALGIARPRVVGEAGEEARVEGLRGRWRVDPAYLDAPWRPGEGRVVLLSPLDHLLLDRKRTVELFDFDYVLEMFRPVARRQFGYWAMPVLDGDRLVGRVDAETVLDAGELQVRGVHPDAGWTPATADAVDARLEELAAWLGVAREDVGPAAR